MKDAPARSDRFLMRRDVATGLEAVRARFHHHAYDMHSHDDEWLVGITHDGVQQFFCRGRQQQSVAGRIILIEPGERHDGHSPDPQGFAYSMLYLQGDRMRAEMGSDAALGFRDTLAEDRLLAQRIALACTAVLDQAPLLVIEHHRDALLLRLRHHLGRQPPEPAICHPLLGQAPPAPAMAERAMDYLKAHFCDEIPSADLAEIAGASSRFQLNRAFRQRFATTPHACQLQLRLAQSRKLLRQGTPPAEAAMSCGFADQSHMTRWFRRAYGMAPGAFARGRTNLQDRD